MKPSAPPKSLPFRRDAFFKVILSDPEMARSFFRTYLPKDLVDAIDWDSLTALPTEMGSTSDNDLRADIIYSVNLRGCPHIQIIFIVEHQSTFDNDMAHRIVIYAVRKLKELQAQLPNTTLIAHGMVIHQNSRPWKSTRTTDLDLPTNLRGLQNADGSPTLLHFGFNLVDLASHSYEDFMTDALIHAPFAVMKFIDDPDPMASIQQLFDCLAHHLSSPDRERWLH